MAQLRFRERRHTCLIAPLEKMNNEQVEDLRAFIEWQASL